MNDKELYKKTFDTLVTGDVLDGNDIAEIKQSAKPAGRKFTKLSTIAAAFAAVLLLGSVTAYAADIGGAKSWLDGYFKGNSVQLQIVQDGMGFATYTSAGERIAYFDYDDSNGYIPTREEYAAMTQNMFYVDDSDLDHIMMYYGDKGFDISKKLKKGKRAFTFESVGQTVYAYFTINEDGTIKNIQYDFDQLLPIGIAEDDYTRLK